MLASRIHLKQRAMRHLPPPSPPPPLRRTRRPSSQSPPLLVSSASLRDPTRVSLSRSRLGTPTPPRRSAVMTGQQHLPPAQAQGFPTRATRGMLWQLVQVQVVQVRSVARRARPSATEICGAPGRNACRGACSTNTVTSRQCAAPLARTRLQTKRESRDAVLHAAPVRVRVRWMERAPLATA